MSSDSETAVVSLDVPAGSSAEAAVDADAVTDASSPATEATTTTTDGGSSNPSDEAASSASSTEAPAAVESESVSTGHPSYSEESDVPAPYDPYDPDNADYVFERPVFDRDYHPPSAMKVLEGELGGALDPLKKIASRVVTVGSGVVNTIRSEVRGLQVKRARKPIFGLLFSDRNLPFDFSTDPKAGNVVVVTHVHVGADDRLVQGLVVLGINHTMLKAGPTSDSEFEEMIERTTLPFTIVFEDPSLTGGEPEEGEEEGGEGAANGSLEAESHGGSAAATAPARSGSSQAAPSAPASSAFPVDAAMVANVTTSLLNSGLTKFSYLSGMVRSGWEGSSAAPAAAAASAPAPPAPSISNPDASSNLQASPPAASRQLPSSPRAPGPAPTGPFSITLQGRSPPFVYDLHADGVSIVVVKLIGVKSANGSSPYAHVQEGCVVRMINRAPVVCKSRQEFDSMLSAAELPITLELEPAPSLYRHQDALQLYSAGLNEKPVHVFTVMPTAYEKIIDAPAPPPSRHATGGIPHPKAQIVYEDTIDTANRATSVLQSFRAQGVAVSMRSMETIVVAIPGKYNPLSSLLGDVGLVEKGSDDYGVYSSVIPSGGTQLRAIRVWFEFPESLTAKVDIPDADTSKALLSAIEVVRNGSDGSWIVIKCTSASSAWVHEGNMILGRPYVLTHVNGFDVSAQGYRSILPRVPVGTGCWEDSVVPFFGKKSVKFTLA